MSVRPDQNSVSFRVLAFVMTATLVSSLAVSWIAIDSQRTALRADLERRHPARLQQLGRALDGWLAERGTSVAETLAQPDHWPLLEVALDETELPPDWSLAIVGDDGTPIAGRLAPAPRPDRLAEVLPYLAKPKRVAGDAAATYVTARPIPGTNAALVGSVPHAVAFASARAVALRVVIADLCLVALFTLLAHRVTRRILEPIHALSIAARRVSQGDLDVMIDLPYPLDARDEIGVLARTFESMLLRLRTNQREIERNNTRLREQNAELQCANEILEQLSITDGLTKVHNHRYFQELLAHEAKRLERTSTPLSLMLIDLDDFKQLNDRYGHAAGDQVLVRLAQILGEAIRDTDVLARYGGEEFVVLSSSTDLYGASILAEKIRMTVEQTAFPIDERENPVLCTVSIGVAQFGGDAQQLFRAADAALYRAKDQGKNCVVSAHKTEAQPIRRAANG